MYKLVFQKLKKINEYEAMELLELNTYERQRSLKPKHLKMLCEEIESGHFLVGDIAVATLEYEDKRKVIVNGQHQLKAVMITGKDINAVFQDYSCQTQEDLSTLYRRFDNHQSRTLGDIVGPEAAAYGITWKRVVLRLVVSAAIFQDNAHSIPKIDKVKYVSSQIRQGDFVDHIIRDGITCKHMKRASVVLAMMNTWDKDKTAAKTFWTNVRDGAGLNCQDPALLLRNYLLTAMVSSNSHRASARKEIVSAREMYTKCIHGWNAYRKGRKTTLKFVCEAPIPKIL